MNLLRLAAQILLIYILYRLVVNFIIPAYRNITRFRKQFRSMQQNMQEQFEQQQRQQNQQTQQATEPKKPETVSSKEGEYIEFEEIKS